MSIPFPRPLETMVTGLDIRQAEYTRSDFVIRRASTVRNAITYISFDMTLTQTGKHIFASFMQRLSSD